MNEHDYAMRDASLANAEDSYFKARPQLMRTRREECLYEAGFKAAWDRLQAELTQLRAEKAAALEQKPVVQVVSRKAGGRIEGVIRRNAIAPEVDSFLYAKPVPTPATVPDEKTIERARDAIAEAIGCSSYDCTRVWSAWGYGTMGPDDFVPIVDQENRLEEITNAAISALLQSAQEPKS